MELRGGRITDQEVLEEVAGGMTNQNIQAMSGGGSLTKGYYVLYGVID